MNRAQRIERVVMGVLAQAMRDAQQTRCTISGNDAASDLLRCWCERTFGGAALGESGLILHPVNKTALLLGFVPAADVLPLGDLYCSQVAELAGSPQLAEPSAELATACGGTAALDEALEQFFDRRAPWSEATAHLPTDARTRLLAALEAARFRRTRVPLIPKLGGRTLGIDLYA